MLDFLADQPPEGHARILGLLQREVVEMAVMLHLDFANGPVRLCNRALPFTDLQNGHLWRSGAGLLVGLPELGGGIDTLAPMREYRLGIPADIAEGENWRAALVDEVRDVANYRGRLAGLYWQLFDHDTGGPVGYPSALDVGIMDKMTCGFSASGVVVSLSSESFLARKGVPVYGMQTYADQKRWHPTDEGLQFVTEAGKLIVWTNW